MLKKRNAVTMIAAMLLTICVFLTSCSTPGGTTSPTQPPLDVTAAPTVDVTDSAEPTATAADVTPTPVESTPEPTAVETTMLTVAEAESLIPYACAVLEGCLLYDKVLFNPENSVDADMVGGYLYCYAQAHAYVQSSHSILSEETVQQLLDIAFGESYTYDMLKAAAENGEFEYTLTEAGWDFDEGESYVPRLTYLEEGDIEFVDGDTIKFSYADTFEEVSGTAYIVIERADSNPLGFRILCIELAAN